LPDHAYAAAAPTMAQCGIRNTTRSTPSMGNKIVTEADRKRSPAIKASPTYTPPKPSSGQKLSQERGTATRSKKNPGKRPHQGG
jgi:hypothetical protein